MHASHFSVVIVIMEPVEFSHKFTLDWRLHCRNAEECVDIGIHIADKCIGLMGRSMFYIVKDILHIYMFTITTSTVEKAINCTSCG